MVKITTEDNVEHYISYKSIIDFECKLTKKQNYNVKITLLNGKKLYNKGLTKEEKDKLIQELIDDMNEYK